jgi:oligosaccharide repeat unit polymerase
MSLILVVLTSSLGVLIGKYLFKKWFNHLTIYCIIMGGLIFFYELKLLPYRDLTTLTWFISVSASISFFLGIVTIITARDLSNRKQVLTSHSTNLYLSIFEDDGKALKYSVLFFSLIGLFVAVQRWYVLINMFGSISAVLVNASVVYRLNVNREIKEFIPILPSFIYVAVFLSGIYSAYKCRFSLLTFLPFIGIVLKELTYFGRGEMLFTSMEFLITFFLFRHLLNEDKLKRFKFSKKNAIIASSILILLMITSASLVRISRGSYENYSGASKELRSLKENFIISPSIYLYLSSDIGVFNKYLESEGEDTKFGQNSFFIIYELLSRFEAVEKPNAFQKGYYIPMWTNTGTYIRELHADFGIFGVLLVPYLLGLIITWLWFKFYEEKNLNAFAFLVYLYLIIGFSFLVMVTRLNQWYFSLFFILLYLPILKKIVIGRKMLNKNTFN